MIETPRKVAQLYACDKTVARRIDGNVLERFTGLGF
jgi:hypothetical protein